MKTKIFATLSVLVAFISLLSPVRAQSTELTNANPDNYTLTGDSLEGINIRTAQDNFTDFFNIPTLESYSNGLSLGETTSLPRNQIFLLPAQSVEENDGVQVQLNLGND